VRCFTTFFIQIDRGKKLGKPLILNGINNFSWPMYTSAAVLIRRLCDIHYVRFQRSLVLENAARQLVFHGSVVLLLGLLFGAPYAKAIKRNAPAQIINSWRVAHQSLPIGATLMLAVAAVMGSLQVVATVKWALAGSLIVSSYAFCVSTPLAALTGDRGLGSGSKGLARLVYLGNMVGAATSLIAAALLLYSALLSL
jgi:hypothetical protein